MKPPAKFPKLDKRRQALVLQYGGLVISIAKQYRLPGQPIDEDLIGEGNIGLAIAAQRFDFERGLKFPTYATHWVRAFVLNYFVNTRGPARIGTTTRQRRILFNMRETREVLDSRDDDKIEQFAAKMKINRSELEEIARYLSTRHISLDAPRALGDGESVHHEIAHDVDVSDDTCSSIDEERRREIFHRAILRLPPREQRIIRARHLKRAEEEQMTLKELGDELGVSRERVRQLECKAIQRLQESCAARL